MHVFCDESGGTGRDDSLFLTAAAPLSADEAARVMKKFRKATGMRGEIKGSRLTFNQRDLFFDLLNSSTDTPIGVAYCDGHSPLGNWALGSIKEQDLWAELLIESVLLIGEGNFITVSADRRYHGSQARRLQDHVSSSIANNVGANRVQVQFVDSENSNGVQIADIVANTVYRMLRGGNFSADILRWMPEQKFAIRPLELKTKRPHWLEPAMA
ncbi:DUF3800 domain-containing protein [Azospirillum rugosum]|uniref:DUF3800 domain-containing protein n=1 Tax=Azospirillum rugosum TaxID=416170 RepID=UPI001AE23B7A|nr:DUF3800 domain-containing protein [Azospirillum rugosum]